MNRSEVILDLQKLKGVTAPSADLYKLQELAANWPAGALFDVTHSIIYTLVLMYHTVN